MARKKKQGARGDDEAVRPAPPPSVGTSLKTLLREVSLSPSPSDAKKPAAHAKPSGGPAKPTGGLAKPSGHDGKRSGTVAKPSSSPGAESPDGGVEVAPRPSDTLRGDDRIAFFDAIAGVRSLDHGKPARPRRAVPIRAADPTPAPSRELVDAPARKKLGELVGGAFRFDVVVEEDGFVEALRRDADIEALGALRRDRLRVDATLDLHGLRESVVEDRLARWLRESHRKGARRVLVIHGKGLHSADGVAVLRDAVLRVLQASVATPLVLAFASAPAAMGGTGAMLVELTKERA